MKFQPIPHAIFETKRSECIPFCITVQCHESRHFRPKLVQWHESIYCTPIDRALQMPFNEGSGSFLRPPFLKVFLKSNALFFGQNKYTNIRKCWAIFRHKTRIFSLKNVQKNIVLSKMAIQDVFNQS